MIKRPRITVIVARVTTIGCTRPKSEIRAFTAPAADPITSAIAMPSGMDALDGSEDFMVKAAPAADTVTDEDGGTLRYGFIE